MRGFWQEIRQAARAAFQQRGATAAAVVTIALGIGACTAIFSVVEGVLLRALPYPDPDRVVQVWQVGKENQNHMQTSQLNFEEWRERSRSFQALAIYNTGSVSVLGGSEPVRLSGALVSRDFFSVFGVQPAIGRTFSPEEMKPGGPPVVLVSHSFWRRWLQGDPELSHHQLTFQNQVHSVIGVMPPEFAFPTGAQLWVPSESYPSNLNRTAHNWLAVGRLKKDITLSLARADMRAVARRQIEENGESIWLSGIDLVRLREQMTANVQTRLWVLFGAVGFLLLVATSNVTNLLLAQAAARQREMAIRTALGAGRLRIFRQHATETLLMALSGGVLGVLGAAWGIPLLLRLEPGDLPRSEGIGINLPVLGFALGLSLLTAILLGVIPTFQATGVNLLESLKDGGRADLPGQRGQRLRGLLVVSQVSLTLVLLVGAGLLGRSFARLLEVDPGFQVDQRVVMELTSPSPSDDASKVRLARFHEELLDRLSHTPGISHVGAVNALPLSGGFSNGQFVVTETLDTLHLDRGGPTQPEIDAMRAAGALGYAEYRVASEGYFGAMGIPLIRGRLPEPADDFQSNHVALISESLAQAQWPNQDPLGKKIFFGNMDGDLRLFTIIGVVGDVRDYGLESNPTATVYGYYKQRPTKTSALSIVLRGPAEQAELVSAARQTLRSLDPETPVKFEALSTVFDASLADRRFSLLLLGLFGAAALALAAVGIFGVMACVVSQRIREIGVRVALGATPGSILRMVVGRGLALTLIGVGVGLVAAAGLTRLISGLLFGVSAIDPWTFAAAVPVLCLVATAACYLPARRASRVDPLVALRFDKPGAWLARPTDGTRRTG